MAEVVQAPPERDAGGPGRRNALAYGLVSLIVSTVGCAAAVSLGPGSGIAIALGVFSAWLIQVGSFWRRAEALGEGRPVLRTWVGGIAARGGGLVLAFGAGTLTRLEGGAVLLAYGGTLLVLLLLEAVWLAVNSPAAPVAGSARPVDRQREIEIEDDGDDSRAA